MTGKDLIRYILDNNLENEPIVQNGQLVGFLSTEEAAVKFNVGIATVAIWYKLGAIDGIELGNTIYIFANAEPTIKKENRFDINKDIVSPKLLQETYTKIVEASSVVNPTLTVNTEKGE